MKIFKNADGTKTLMYGDLFLTFDSYRNESCYMVLERNGSIVCQLHDNTMKEFGKAWRAM